MSLVPSLLQAIVRVDGEALVMHAGDKPYVVSPDAAIAGAVASAPVDDNDELPIEMLGFDGPADAMPPSAAAAVAETPLHDDAIELDDDLLLPDAVHLWPD